MVVLVTCKNEEDPIKIKALEWPQYFPHYKSMEAICCRGNQSSGPVWPKPNAAFLHPKYSKK